MVELTIKQKLDSIKEFRGCVKTVPVISKEEMASHIKKEYGCE